MDVTMRDVTMTDVTMTDVTTRDVTTRDVTMRDVTMGNDYERRDHGDVTTRGHQGRDRRARRKPPPLPINPLPPVLA